MTRNASCITAQIINKESEAELRMTAIHLPVSYLKLVLIVKSTCEIPHLPNLDKSAEKQKLIHVRPHKYYTKEMLKKRNEVIFDLLSAS